MNDAMRMILLVLLLVVVPFGGCLASHTAQADTVHYVDNSGSPACSDSNAGTSQSAPWCTVSKAMSAITGFAPGDSVLFRCGDTWKEMMTIPSGVHGSSGNNIVIGHYGDNCVVAQASSYNGRNDSTAYQRTLPILDEESKRTNCILANQAKVSYLTIDGFDCHDSTVGGINFWISNPGNVGIVLENNSVHEVGSGAYTGATQGPDNGGNANCTSNPPHGAGGCDNNSYGRNAGLSFGDTSTSEDGTQILNNVVWDTGGHNTILLHYDTSTKALVSGNVAGPGCFHNCIDTKGLNGIVQNNIVTCPIATSRPVGGWGQCSVQSNKNSGFYTQNTISFATTGTWQNNVAFDISSAFQIDSANTRNPKLYGNTIYNVEPAGMGLYLSSCVGADVQNNLFTLKNAFNKTTCVTKWDYNNNYQNRDTHPTGPHDINVDPGYVAPDATAPDFHTTNSTVNTLGASNPVVPGVNWIGALGPPSAPAPTPTATSVPTPTPPTETFTMHGTFTGTFTGTITPNPNKKQKQKHRDQ